MNIRVSTPFIYNFINFFFQAALHVLCVRVCVCACVREFSVRVCELKEVFN